VRYEDIIDMTKDCYLRQMLADGIEKKLDLERELSGDAQKHRINYIMRRLHRGFQMPMGLMFNKKLTSDCSGITYAAIKRAVRELKKNKAKPKYFTGYMPDGKFYHDLPFSVWYKMYKMMILSGITDEKEVPVDDRLFHT